MKSSGMLLAIVSLASVAAFGQGQFCFNNRIEGELDERIYLPGDAGFSNIGTPDWSVLLFGGPSGTPVANLVPLEPPSTTFLGPPGSEAAGYVVGLILTVPGAPPGGNADVIVRIVGPGGVSFDQGPFGPVGLGGGGIPIPTLPFRYYIYPEPATPVLALVALAVFLVAKASRSFRNGNGSGSEKGQTDSV
ncbi:MAG: hypothetical protein AB9869_09950 [Verrucomicrobiia bacterium]